MFPAPGWILHCMSTFHATCWQAGWRRRKRFSILAAAPVDGAAMLARQGAASVVGLDMDSSTIEWAKSERRGKDLSFCVSTDLGAGFPSHTFDLVTCFEMIEHVSERGQRAAIASIARLLKKNGILLISTPNPAVTKLYGANPFHLRELTEQEFLTPTQEHFQHIQLNYQFVHEGTLIGPKSQSGLHRCACRIIAWHCRKITCRGIYRSLF